MERREFFKTVGAVAAVSAVLPTVSFAKSGNPNKMDYKTAISAVTNGKQPKMSDKVKLKVPEIAENGAVVPVTVIVDSPMTPQNYVKSIHIFSTKNSNARCLDTNLSPANGKAMVATRIKLNGTQEVIAVVELSNGEFLMNKKSIKVTIGGCG